MAQHETYIRKNYHGQWEARTVIMLSPTHEFTVLTAKRSTGSVATTASVGQRDGISVVHMVFQDYSKTLHLQKYPRVTQKVIETQHNEILKDIDAWTNEARAQYGLELEYAA